MYRLISARLMTLLLCLIFVTRLFAAGGGGGGGGGGAEFDDPNKKTGPYKDAMEAIQAQKYAQAIPILENWVAGHRKFAMDAGLR